MIQDPPENLLDVLKSCTPDLRKPVSVVRSEISRFYIDMQSDFGERPGIERVEVSPGVPGFWIDVPKDSEQRVDWVVRVLHSGTATIRMTAQTDEESDATEIQFPVLVHGAEKFEVQSGVMRDVTPD
jgi:hypothetical protein